MKGNKLFKKIDRWVGVPIVLFLGIAAKLCGVVVYSKPKPLSPGDRVLAVKLSALGDTFILLPVFKAIKEKIGPTGKILMIATSINQAALEGFKEVDKVLIVNFSLFAKNPKSLWNFIKKLREFRAVVAFDFDQWLRISPLLCFISGASQKYGFKTAGQYRHYLYQKTVTNEKNRHEFEQFISIAGLAGVEQSGVDHFNGFLEREKLYGHSPQIPSKELLIHIHPGCGESGWQRAWPENYYIELIKLLRNKTKAKIQMTGMGIYEENLVHKIIKESSQEVADFSGKLEIGQLSNLLRKADLVICGNTGIMHLAVGLGCSLIAPHGPTNPTKWGPIASTEPHEKIVSVLAAKIACSPCLNLGFEYGCDARPCMESISVNSVFEESLSLLEKTGKLEHKKI